MSYVLQPLASLSGSPVSLRVHSLMAEKSGGTYRAVLRDYPQNEGAVLKVVVTTEGPK